MMDLAPMRRRIVQAKFVTYTASQVVVTHVTAQMHLIQLQYLQKIPLKPLRATHNALSHPKENARGMRRPGRAGHELNHAHGAQQGHGRLELAEEVYVVVEDLNKYGDRVCDQNTLTHTTT